MKNIVIVIVMCIGFLQAQTYCAGDQISIQDQNAVHIVGAPFAEYEVGDEFRLADWNGDLNGGNYSIIFVDMSASW